MMIFACNSYVALFIISYLEILLVAFVPICTISKLEAHMCNIMFAHREHHHVILLILVFALFALILIYQ